MSKKKYYLTIIKEITAFMVILFAITIIPEFTLMKDKFY